MQSIAGSRRPTQFLLVAGDALILMAAILAANWLRFGSEVFNEELSRILAHPGFIVYAVLAQVGLATTFSLYNPESWRSKEVLPIRLAALALTLGVALALGVYFVMPWRFGRGLLALTVFLALPIEGMVRYLLISGHAQPSPSRALLIGDGPIVSALEEELRRQPNPPIRIVRHLGASEASNNGFLEDEEFDEIDLVIIASLADELTTDRLAALNFRGTTVVDSAGAYAALTGRIPVLQVDSRWFIATGDFSTLATSSFHYVQRFLDVLIATGLLVFTAPILLLAAGSLLVFEGRPIVFRQVRLGRFGRPFVLHKLRTMRLDSEEKGPRFASRNDERVFPLGRVLRRWRIDELPQLVNVLRGEMSLVGPRPEQPELARRLEADIPFYAFRYSVRPGLTGWAQVNVPYCTDPEEHLVKLEFDLYSLRHHGPALYATVLMRTLGSLIFQPER